MELSPRRILGLNVNRLRQEAGLTQEQFAERAEVDRRYVQYIEKGTANVGIDVLHRLKLALGVEWEELLELPGGEKSDRNV